MPFLRRTTVATRSSGHDPRVPRIFGLSHAPLAFYILCSLLPCRAQVLPAGRPIIFVHGWCGTADGWGTVRDAVVSYISTKQPTLYTDSTNYTVYYDGQDTHFWPSETRAARFFSIQFFDPTSTGALTGPPSINTTQVASVSILNKADELAHVIGAIKTLTQASDVIIIAHSLGGLAARAYLQGLAVHSPQCNDQDSSYGGCTSAPKTAYAGDVAKLITLDTPHSGAVFANYADGLTKYLQAGPGCQLTQTLNRRELEEGSLVVKMLNTGLATSPAFGNITSIMSYTTTGFFSPRDDGIVTDHEQSIHNLALSVQSYRDVENLLGASPLIGGAPSNCIPANWPLHLLSCLAMQPSTISYLNAELAQVLVEVPSINAGGILNAASYIPGAPVAPGTIVAVYGNFLVNSTFTANGVPWPKSMGGVALQFADGSTAPLYYVSGGQVSLVIPWELSGRSQTSLTATVSGQTSASQTVNLAQYSPGIFSMNGQGTGQGAIVDAVSGLVVDSSNPAIAGSTYLAIYCTGLGPVINQPASGAAGPSGPLAATTTTPTVTIGGVPAQVAFAGLAPGFVGLYQVNVQLPAGVASGNAVPVVIGIGGATSNTVTIAVKQPPPSQGLALQSVNLSATSVTGGNSVIGTVTLSSAAPTGGVQVTLSSDNSSAQVPASVTISSGQSSTTFTITTTAVTSAQTATIAAHLGTSTAMAVLRVAPGSPTQVNITEFSVPTASGYPFGIAVGPDGALWFAELSGTKIGRITTAGVITEYPLPVSSFPNGIAAGPDGALWFTEGSRVKIGRITTTGVVTEYSVPTSSSAPYEIVSGPDGALWFTETSARKIGRITTAGVVTEYPVPGVPWEIAGGPDGALWFTEVDGKIGRITTTGIITEYPIPTSSGYPGGIAAGPDGALWFTEVDGNKIGRITTTGVITEYPVPSSASARPWTIAAGSDGALWFTAASMAGVSIGRITTTGVITEYPVPTFTAFGGIVTGPDGAVWFTETQGNKIGRAGLTTVTVPTAPTLQSLMLSSTSVTGGSSLTGTVTLASPAPTGGVQVTLSSNNSNVKVPPAANIPAGGSSVTFTITTTAVTTAQSVTITATYGGSSRSATLAVNPAPSSSSLRGQQFAIDGSMSIGGQTIGIEIQAVTLNGGNSYTVLFEQLSNLYPVSLTFAF